MDPLAQFSDRLVRQADDVEHHAARHDLHLDIDRPRLDALERHRRYPDNHLSIPLILISVNYGLHQLNKYSVRLRE